MEELTERSGILIANLPRNLIDGALRELKLFARFADADVLNIFDGRLARSRLEPPLPAECGTARSSDN